MDQVDRVKKLVDEIFSDTGRSQEETKDILKLILSEVEEQISIMLEALE